MATKKNPSKKPASESAQNKTAEEIARHIKLLDSMNLPRVQINVPEGTHIEEWIFPVLDKSGFIIRVNDQSDFRWATIHAAGLPKDMPRVDVLFSVAPHNPTYKDFAIHGKGAIADPSDLEKGKGGWLWTLIDNATGQTMMAHIWLVTIFLRNSSTSLLASYNAGTDPLYTRLRRGSIGITVELMNVEFSDEQSGHRLLREGGAIINGLQEILDAAVTANRGRPPKAVVGAETIPSWSPQYDRAIQCLQSELNARGSKQLGRHPFETRAVIIRLAFPELDRPRSEALAEFSSVSDVALRYTGWACSKIEIGTWERTQYLNILRESRRINGRMVHGKGPSVALPKSSAETQGS